MPSRLFHSPLPGLLFAGALALTAAACDGCSDGDGISSANGNVRIETESVDFGYVIVGQQKEISLPIVNDGRGPLTVSSIIPGENFPAELSFSPPSFTLASGESITLSLLFRPEENGIREGTLTLLNDGNGGDIQLHLRGIGLVPLLEADPSAIVFEPTIVEQVSEQSLRLTNSSEGPLDVVFSPMSGETPEAFRATFEGESVNTHRLEAGESVLFTVQFSPLVPGPASAVLKVLPCVGCVPLNIELSGEGLAAGLVAEPSVLDFGVVAQSSLNIRSLTLRNIGNKKISITGMRVSAAPLFALEDDFASGYPVLEGGDTVQLNVSFNAGTTLGSQVAKLIVESDDEHLPLFEITLKGYVGGAVVGTLPPAIDFGVVGIGFPVSRRVSIVNRGVSDPTSTDDDLIVEGIELVDADPTLALSLLDALPLRIEPGARAQIELAFSPTEVASSTGTLRLKTSDVVTPVLDVPVLGRGIEAPPCDYTVVPGVGEGLDFGVVPRARTSQRSFRLTNTGASTCIIGKLDLADDAPEAFSLPNGALYGQLLEAGEYIDTPVDFTPPGSVPSGTDFVGALELGLSSQSAPTTFLPLSGRAAEVCLQITPAGVDFGPVKTECLTTERKFTVHNACSSSVTITEVLTTQSPAALPGEEEFHLTAPVLPRVLAPGTQLQFSVRYRARDIGDDFGTVEIRTNQPVASESAYLIPLTATGATPEDAVHEENFVQADQAKADILFVIDDSGSMSDEQRTLASEFNSFMSFAISQQIDYQIAVTTTDTDGYGASSNGRFVGQPLIVTPNLSSPSEAFGRNVTVGTNGSATECGLEAAYLALSDPLINGHNAGFLRPDAFLSVIIVSDEEDYSKRPLDFYVNFFSNIKGPRGMNLVSVSGIVGTSPGGCSGPGGSADFGARYVQAASRTNGISESICNSNWSQALQQLGLIAFGYKTRFLLSSDPDPASIKVFINGNEVPRGMYWQFTPDSNSIDFLPTAIPPPGSQIRVSYTVACSY